MGQIFFQVYSYIQHWLKRKDEHSLHSPFLFDFYVKVIKNKASFKVDSIEKYRSALLQNNSQIPIEELGALSKKHDNVRIKNKAGSSLSPLEQSCFLGSLVSYLKPQTLLEIGTSFGVSTAYLAQYASQGKVITLEGEPNIASISQEFFTSAKFEKVGLLLGEFDHTLPLAIKNLETLDFVFFDGNHRYSPTLQYFELCLMKKNENSVFVFHDIYWSSEMKKAWEAIKSNIEVTITVDLYYFGVVFFRKNQPKQHFVLKF